MNRSIDQYVQWLELINVMSINRYCDSYMWKKRGALHSYWFPLGHCSKGCCSQGCCFRGCSCFRGCGSHGCCSYNCWCFHAAVIAFLLLLLPRMQLPWLLPSWLLLRHVAPVAATPVDAAQGFVIFYLFLHDAAPMAAAPVVAASTTTAFAVVWLQWLLLPWLLLSWLLHLLLLLPRLSSGCCFRSFFSHGCCSRGCCLCECLLSQLNLTALACGRKSLQDWGRQCLKMWIPTCICKEIFTRF